MAQAMIAALIKSQCLHPNQIFVSNRTPGKLLKLTENFGITAVTTNEALVEQSDLIIIGVKPQDFPLAVEPIANSISEHQIILSMAAGIKINQLQRMIPRTRQIVRILPNTPVKIQQGVTGYFLKKELSYLKSLIEHFLKPLGAVISVDDEDLLAPLSVGCSAGVGFVLELMQYWQEWFEEHDFSSQQSKEMTIKTFLGAAQLAQQATAATELSELQNRVVSKKGITAAGLNSMRELEIERLLRYSFEKAALRDKEIAQEQS